MKEIYKGKNTQAPKEAVYDWACGVLYKDDNGNFCLYHEDGLSNPVAENSLGKWTGRKDKTDSLTLVCENDIISFNYRFRTCVGKIVRTSVDRFKVLYVTVEADVKNKELKHIKLSSARRIAVIGNGYNNLSEEEVRKEIILAQKIYLAKRAKLLKDGNDRYGYTCPFHYHRYGFCFNAYKEGKCKRCSSIYCYFNQRRAEGKFCNLEGATQSSNDAYINALKNNVKLRSKRTMTVREIYASGIFLHSDPVYNSDPCFFTFDEETKQRKHLTKEEAMDCHIEGIYADGSLYVRVTKERESE